MRIAPILILITFLFIGTVIAADSPPVANFTSNASIVCESSGGIQFRDTSTNTPTSWNWSFGDGNYSTSQNPAKQFGSTGAYTVTLTASNAYGNGTVTKYIVVSTECRCEQIQVLTNNRFPIPLTLVFGAIFSCFLIYAYAPRRKKDV